MLGWEWGKNKMLMQVPYTRRRRSKKDELLRTVRIGTQMEDIARVDNDFATFSAREKGEQLCNTFFASWYIISYCAAACHVTSGLASPPPPLG